MQCANVCMGVREYIARGAEHVRSTYTMVTFYMAHFTLCINVCISEWIVIRESQKIDYICI